MASLGHVAVGLAAARVFPKGGRPAASAMLFWSGLSLMPDVDVVGFAMGVEYGDPWGHRGATHSVVFSLAVGLVVGLAARWSTRPPLRTGVVACAVLISHSLLDTMTDGGLGCALLWPLSLDRYFAPWRPIPVAPIGLSFVSPAGAAVTVIELVLFAPALLYALVPPRRVRKGVAAFVIAWLVVVSLLWFNGGSRGAIAGVLLREDTRYTAGFSETAFRSIEPGQSTSDVRRLLGAPYREFWFYTTAGAVPPDERAAPEVPGCLSIRFENGLVSAAHEATDCETRGITIGLTTRDVQRRLGRPEESCWQYSWTPAEANYRQRLVCFSAGQVHLVVRKWG